MFPISSTSQVKSLKCSYIFFYIASMLKVIVIEYCKTTCIQRFFFLKTSNSLRKDHLVMVSVTKVLKITGFILTCTLTVLSGNWGNGGPFLFFITGFWRVYACKWKFTNRRRYLAFWHTFGFGISSIYSITKLEDNGDSCSVRCVRHYTQINVLLSIRMWCWVSYLCSYVNCSEGNSLDFACKRAQGF